MQCLNLSINHNVSKQNQSGFQQDLKLTVETGHFKSLFIYLSFSLVSILKMKGWMTLTHSDIW